MSKKYTIEDHDDYCALICDGKGEERFENFGLCKRVCRLLNDDEQRRANKKQIKMKESIQGELLKYLADRVEYYNKESDSETGDKYDAALWTYYKNAYEKIKSLESE